jgi:hypothetical protein
LAPFFCSTAPLAFFRPDRRFRTPSRAGAVKAGRRSASKALSGVSRPRLDSPEHGGSIGQSGQAATRLYQQRDFQPAASMDFKPVAFDQFHAVGDNGWKEMVRRFGFQTLSNALERVRYPGVDLTAVRWTPPSSGGSGAPDWELREEGTR